MPTTRSVQSFFEFLGLAVASGSGDELTCDCPFCEKELHLHVNISKGVFHCKYCDASGNTAALVEQLLARTLDLADRDQLKNLANARRLPVDAFVDRGIIHRAGVYGIPIRNRDGSIANVRRYKPRGKLLNAPRMSSGLYGAEYLADPSSGSSPIYICEGEWDTIAVEYVRRQADMPGVVVGVPGASVFKTTWVDWLHDRDIFILFDNDEAGQKGTQKLKAKLTAASSIHALSWPESAQLGMDLNDLISEMIP